MADELPPFLFGMPDPAAARAAADFDAAVEAENLHSRAQMRRFEAVLCSCIRPSGWHARWTAWDMGPPQGGCVIHSSVIIARDGRVL